jgi:DNA-directed RNA polymerase specialized sigma24 family protein
MADYFGIKQQTVHIRKSRLLKKLKKFLEK